METTNTIKITSLQKNSFSDLKETIILIHGFLCYSTLWQPLILQLKNDYNIFTIGLPGHNGDSETIISIENLAFEISVALKSQSLTNVHLVGHSLGGYLAGEITKQKQIKPRSITIINSSLLSDSNTKKHDRDLAIRAVKITPNIFAQNVIEKLFLEKNRRKLQFEIKKIQNRAEQITSDTIISYLEAMKNRNKTIDSISDTPIHFISSVNDTTIPFDLIPAQVKKSNARLTTLKNSGHMGFLEETDLVVKSINSFFVPFTSLLLK